MRLGQRRARRRLRLRTVVGMMEWNDTRRHGTAVRSSFLGMSGRARFGPAKDVPTRSKLRFAGSSGETVGWSVPFGRVFLSAAVRSDYRSTISINSTQFNSILNRFQINQIKYKKRISADI